MQIFLGMKHRSSLWIFILGVGWFRFDICLAERGVAVSPVNKHSVSLSHIHLCLTRFLLSHWMAFSQTFHVLVFSCLSGKLFWQQAVLFCMYYVWWRNMIWKTGKTSAGMITKRKFLLNETNYSFKSKGKTVNWSSCYWQGTCCSSWKQVTKEVNLRVVIWTEEVPTLATLFYREQMELWGLYS